MPRDQKECEVGRNNKTSYEDRTIFLSFIKFIRRFQESTLHDETP